MSEQNICSRRQAEKYIEAGKVWVNDELAHIGQIIDPKKDTIVYDVSIGSRVFHYFLYHKPVGIVTTNPGPGEIAIANVLDLPDNVVPIGRLDKETSGLIILTDDGRIQKRLMDPLVHIEKEYLVTLSGEPTDHDIDQIRRGVMIQGYITKPAQCYRYSKKSVIMTITEGKNRQVRRMRRSCGNHVVGLHRRRIGSYVLGDIKVGTYASISISHDDILAQ